MTMGYAAASDCVGESWPISIEEAKGCQGRREVLRQWALRNDGYVRLPDVADLVMATGRSLSNRTDVLAGFRAHCRDRDDWLYQEPDVYRLASAVSAEERPGAADFFALVGDGYQPVAGADVEHCGSYHEVVVEWALRNGGYAWLQEVVDLVIEAGLWPGMYGKLIAALTTYCRDSGEWRYESPGVYRLEESVTVAEARHCRNYRELLRLCASRNDGRARLIDVGTLAARAGIGRGDRKAVVNGLSAACRDGKEWARESRGVFRLVGAAADGEAGASG